MRVRIRVGFVWIIVAMLSVLGACQHAAGPEDATPSATMSSTVNDAIYVGIANEPAIAHLLIASVEMQSLAFTEDLSEVSEVSTLLTESELAVLLQRRIVWVEDPSVASAIVTIVGIDVSDPAVTARGVLVTTYTEVTWGRIKCCFKDPKCCPKKKKEQ